jgi:hypothetical protein
MSKDQIKDVAKVHRISKKKAAALVTEFAQAYKQPEGVIAKSLVLIPVNMKITPDQLIAWLRELVEDQPENEWFYVVCSMLMEIKGGGIYTDSGKLFTSIESLKKLVNSDE